MSTIKLRRSSVPNKVPTVQQLDLGEIAINTYDGKMFLKQYQEYFDDELQENVTYEEIVEIAGSVPIENTLYVQKSGNDRNDGDTWSSAFATIERALEAAAERETITLIDIGPGIYETQGHLDVPDNTVIKATHRTVFIKPVSGYEERNVFRLGSGCFLEGPVFEGWRLDDMDNPTEGFAVCFRPGALITRVPYVHKIVVRTPPYWTSIAPPLDRENANPLVGRGAGVVLADASVLDPDSIFPNIMTWGATPVTHNGIGYCAKNGALINAVNAVSLWCHRHFYALSGGQIILSSCSTQFGDYTMVSSGTRNIVNPTEATVTLTEQNDASLAIDAAKTTIINNLINQLNTESFTSGWPEDYEDITERDAGLFLQALSWTLKTANERPMLDFAKGFFDTQGNRTFTAADYDYDRCFRDTLIINEAVAYDLLFNSNFRSIKSALAYYRANASEVLTNQKTNTLLALAEQKSVFGSYLSGTSLTRANALFDEIVDIITNGINNADAFVLTDPSDYDTGYFNARRLMMANKTFIQDEIDAWIAVQVAGNISPFSSAFTYDSAACRRDVGFIIDALRYDLTYGGNLETYNAAMAYYVGVTAQFGADEKLPTIAAFQRLKNILGDILQGIEITKSSGNISTQDISGTPGSSGAASFAQARMDNIINTIDADGTPPVKVSPSTSWPESEFRTSFNTVTTNTRQIVRSVLRYLNLETKSLLGAFIYSWEYLRDQVNALADVGSTADGYVTALVTALTQTILDPALVSEPSTITAIGHTWTGIMSGVALTKIPPSRNLATIEESILELNNGIVIASGQDDQGSALFIGGMKIDADTGELTGPPFEQSVNRIATRAAIARSF
jgi:hypothetical protein